MYYLPILPETRREGGGRRKGRGKEWMETDRQERSEIGRQVGKQADMQAYRHTGKQT